MAGANGVLTPIVPSAAMLMAVLISTVSATVFYRFPDVGCETQFTSAGLAQHLHQMQKPKCKAIHKVQEALLASNTYHNDPPSLQPSAATASLTLHPFDDTDMDTPPIPFEGDYFGDYKGEFFGELGDGWPEGPLLSDSDSDSDSGNEDEELEFESWEPALCTHPDHDGAEAPADEPAPGSSSNDVHADLNMTAAAAAAWRAIEANTACKTFMVHYPSSHAGAPIPKSKLYASTNETYGSALDPNGLDAANPYAPFASKLDWEIARWAKLHDPGSTMFTDLLAIKEVS